MALAGARFAFRRSCETVIGDLGQTAPPRLNGFSKWTKTGSWALAPQHLWDPKYQPEMRLTRCLDMPA
jgi:hypothetical protein